MTGTIRKPPVVLIPNSTDIDTMTTSGVFQSPMTIAGVATLVNCPVTTPFSMLVTGSGDTTGAIQTIFSQNYIYTRRGTSSGFGSWYRYAGTAV